MTIFFKLVFRIPLVCQTESGQARSFIGPDLGPCAFLDDKGQ